MKKLLMLLLVATMVFSIGCTKDDEEDRTIDDVIIDANFSTLVDHVKSLGGFTFLVAAAPDDETIDDSTQAADFIAGFELVVDLRSAADYDAGHIAGAVNWSATDFKDNLLEANPTETTLIACYTGQTASHLQTVASLMGYTAKILKWGMSGWSSATDSWSSNTKADFGAWSDDVEVPEVEWFDTPELTESGTGAAILDARLDIVVAGNLQGIASAVTMADDVVFNYWGLTDWEDYGHIENANRLNPGSFTVGNDGENWDALYNLPANEVVNVYCYTGQTSAALTTFLNTLGYTTKSIKFGVNGMIFDNHPITWHTRHVDLPLVQ